MAVQITMGCGNCDEIIELTKTDAVIGEVECPNCMGRYLLQYWDRKLILDDHFEGEDDE